MGQKHKRFRESRIPLRGIRKNPRSMYERVLQAMAQFVLKIEKLSHIMGPTPILEMARLRSPSPIMAPVSISLRHTVDMDMSDRHKRKKKCFFFLY